MAADYEVEIAEWRAIVERDADAFERWFNRCEIPLKLALRSFATTVDVESIVQETAIIVWREVSTIRPDGRTAFLLRWAHVVARRAALNAAKRPGCRVVHNGPPPESEKIAGHDGVMADPWLRARLKQCLEHLPLHQRRVLTTRLHDAGLRSDRDLAQDLGISFDTLRQTLTRTRRALVKCLSGFQIDVMGYLR